MDGREGMAFHGSAPCYLNRGSIGGSGGSVTGPNAPAGGGSGMPQTGVSGGSVSDSAFHVENRSPNFPRSMSTAAGSTVTPGTDSGKKKRGRPRKYGPDGANMSLALAASTPSSGAITPGEKPRRGRPAGSGWKQQLASLGEWMNSSAGLAFTPHVLHIGIEEDIAAKVLAFAQQRPRALCILSANGSVSTVTLRQPTTSGGTITYEGRFEILCLSGSYLVAEGGGPCNRTGGISISVCSPDGHIFGGAVGGRLIAASPVQLVVCSFVYGGSKAKSQTELEPKDEKNPADQSVDQLLTPVSAAPSQNYASNSATGIWPSGLWPDVKNPQSDIDLMRG